MTVAANTLHEYAGKNIKITLVGANAGEYEGKMEAAGPQGAVFKPKGKGSLMLAPDEISAIEVASVVKKLVRKSMLPCTVDNVRQHLIDRHGYNVADIEKYEPQGALDWHVTIDHAPLGHDHEKKSAEAAA